MVDRCKSKAAHESWRLNKHNSCLRYHGPLSLYSGFKLVKYTTLRSKISYVFALTSLIVLFSSGQILFTETKNKIGNLELLFFKLYFSMNIRQFPLAKKKHKTKRMFFYCLFLFLFLFFFVSHVLCFTLIIILFEFYIV